MADNKDKFITPEQFEVLLKNYPGTLGYTGDATVSGTLTVNGGLVVPGVLEENLEATTGTILTANSFPSASSCYYLASQAYSKVASALTDNTYTTVSGTYGSTTITTAFECTSSSDTTVKSGSTWGGTYTWTATRPTKVKLSGTGVYFSYWTTAKTGPYTRDVDDSEDDGSGYTVVGEVYYKEEMVNHSGYTTVTCMVDGSIVSSNSWVSISKGQVASITIEEHEDKTSPGDYAIYINDYNYYGGYGIFLNGSSSLSIPNTSSYLTTAINLTIGSSSIKCGSGQSSWTDGITKYSYFLGLTDSTNRTYKISSCTATFTDASGTYKITPVDSGDSFVTKSDNVLTFTNVQVNGTTTSSWSTSGRCLSSWSVSIVPVGRSVGVYVGDLKRNSATSEIGTKLYVYGYIVPYKFNKVCVGTVRATTVYNACFN